MRAFTNKVPEASTSLVVNVCGSSLAWYGTHSSYSWQPSFGKSEFECLCLPYSPCQPACACVPHPSFVSSWVGSERWHIKSVCVWVRPREMATHSTGTQDLFFMSFSTPAYCALREGYLPPSLSRKLRSVTCSILDHSTQLCPRGPSPHALGQLYSRNNEQSLPCEARLPVCPKSGILTWELDGSREELLCPPPWGCVLRNTIMKVNRKSGVPV